VTRGQWEQGGGVCVGSFTGAPASRARARAPWEGPTGPYLGEGGAPVQPLLDPGDLRGPRLGPPLPDRQWDRDGSRDGSARELDPRMKRVEVEVHIIPERPPARGYQSVPRSGEDLGDALCAAASCGDVARMHDLVLQGASVRYYQRRQRSSTPLMYACASVRECEEAVRWLLDRCACMDEANEDGWSPLKLAACRGHVGVVGLLLERGAPCDTMYHQGRTALMCAAAGDLEFGPGLPGRDPPPHNAGIGALPSLARFPAPPADPSACVRDKRLRDDPTGRRQNVVTFAMDDGAGAGAGELHGPQRRAQVVKMLARKGADFRRKTRHGVNVSLLNPKSRSLNPPPQFSRASTRAPPRCVAGLPRSAAFCSGTSSSRSGPPSAGQLD